VGAQRPPKPYGVPKNMVFQSFTAETAEFAEKILENSAFSRVLCGEKGLSYSVDKPSMCFENTMTKTQNGRVI
jgi:hypothetical protein